MMKKQTFFPKNIATHDISLISTLGLKRPFGGYCHHPEFFDFRRGKEWGRRQICRGESFVMVAGEGYHSGPEAISYTQWEDYIKVNFRLSGRITTILDGFGQHEHDRPEVFIVSGPPQALKVDVMKAGGQNAGVSLSLRRDFFPLHLGLEPEQLPEPLRSLAVPATPSYAFYRFQLTSDLTSATRAILQAPFAVRRSPIYAQAKAIELMCLLIGQMQSERHCARAGGEAHAGRDSRLHDARDLLSRRYAEAITLEQICREVGMNRLALTSGFRQLFGMTVYDCLQKERMERAYELLQDASYSIAHVAEAIGYSHSCTFSTAFHGYFGCSPRKVRASLR